MSSSNPSDEIKILEAMKRSWESDFHFFSNAGKEEREKWVVGEFLGHLQVEFSVEELNSHEQNSKIDVEFRDAQFQIKEIITPGSRRGAEVKASYKRVTAAQSLEETIGPMFSYDIPPIADAYELITLEASELANDARYIAVKMNLDLLFYVTHTRAAQVKEENVDSVELSGLGWRSISCLMRNEAMILFARNEAPSFLRRNGS